MHTVFVRLPSPLAPLQLHSLPSSTAISSLPLPFSLSSSTYLRTRSSLALKDDTPISHLTSEENGTVFLELGVRMLGGKGGFGSQLRAAGGRMSAGKKTNNDSCRDLNGRRLRTLQEADRMAEIIESHESSSSVQLANDKAKLESLERQLGISSAPTSSSAPIPTPAAGPSNSKPLTQAEEMVQVAQKRKKFDDAGFFETSREINDGVRNAVTAGLLKKRKKAKVSPEPSVTTASTEAGNGKGKGKAAEPTPAPAPLVEKKGTEVVSAVAATA